MNLVDQKYLMIIYTLQNEIYYMYTYDIEYTLIWGKYDDKF